MKKILFILISFFFLNITTTYAQTYYGEEKTFPYQENPIKSQIDNRIEANIFYHLYQIKRINGNYRMIQEEDEEYPFLDKTKWKYTTWSDWTEEKIEYQEGRVINERIVYQVKRPKKVRYFYFYDVNGGKDDFHISELSFYAQGEKLDVIYECENCSEGYEIIAQNEIMKEQPFSLPNGSFIKVDLKEEYFMEDLKVVYALYDEGYQQKDYSTAFDYKDTLVEKPYYYNTIASAFTYSDYSDIEQREFTVKDYARPKVEWDNFISVSKVTEDEQTTVKPLIQRRYRDTLYQSYREEKITTEDYYLFPTEEYPYIDYSSGKVFYQETVISMIEMNDCPILYQKEELEKELILFSNVPYQIIESIDYETNGIYEVEIKTDFLDITTFIELKIPENEMKKYKNQITELEKVRIWMQEENQKLSDLLLKKEEENHILKLTIQNLYIEIQGLKNMIQDIENKMEDAIKENSFNLEQLQTELNSLKSKKDILESKIQILESSANQITCPNYDTAFLEIDDKITQQQFQIEKLKQEDEKTQKMIETYQSKGQNHHILSWIFLSIFLFLLFLIKRKKERSSFVETV